MSVGEAVGGCPEGVRGCPEGVWMRRKGIRLPVRVSILRHSQKSVCEAF